MIGNRIKTIRKKRNITQKQLAKEIGVSAPTVTRYETGEISPPIEQLTKISTVLNVNVSELMGGFTVTYEKGELAINNLLADLGGAFRYPQHEIYDEFGEFIDIKCDPPLLEYNGNYYTVDENTEQLLRKEVIAYTEFKLQQIIEESLNNKEN